MTKIIVPASSANLGVGFDSIGFAVNLYLELEILEPSKDWQIDHDYADKIPTDASNLVIETALKVSENLAPHRLKMKTDIPFEHGLGSSSSAIVAGIELANELGQLDLSKDERLLLACQFEGHPDNVAPALRGGGVVASYSQGQVTYVDLNPPHGVALVAYVPDYSVSTKVARSVLPENYSREEAVLASSRANVLAAGLAIEDYEAAFAMIEQDLFHEKYRSSLIPELSQVRALAHEHGAFATYLSGAGSTIMTLITNDEAAEFAQSLKSVGKGEVLQLKFDYVGTEVV